MHQTHTITLTLNLTNIRGLHLRWESINRTLGGIAVDMITISEEWEGMASLDTRKIIGISLTLTLTLRWGCIRYEKNYCHLGEGAILESLRVVG